MGSSFERSKKKVHLWKKAAIHFSLCFVMGFFTGFAPTSTASFFSSQVNPYRSIKNLGITAEPAQTFQKSAENASLNRSLMSSFPAETLVSPHNPKEEEVEEEQEEEEVVEDIELRPQTPLIIITTTRPHDRFQGPLLRRLANTLRLVPAPLLWIVVEAHRDAAHTAEVLRKTGIMYRYLTYKENFTDPDVESDHQRNVALNHVEYHRLNGIVHFADASNTYDLEFFEEIRDIDVFGTWSVVMASANGRRLMVEGPICSSSKVVGWQAKDLNNDTMYSTISMFNADSNNVTDSRPDKINISGFAFNSSILWDPERWGRPSSVLDSSQDSMKFVQEVVLEDETKLKAIPSDCSKILLWHLHLPRTLIPSSTSQI